MSRLVIICCNGKGCHDKRAHKKRDSQGKRAGHFQQPSFWPTRLWTRISRTVCGVSFVPEYRIARHAAHRASLSLVPIVTVELVVRHCGRRSRVGISRRSRERSFGFRARGRTDADFVVEMAEGLGCTASRFIFHSNGQTGDEYADRENDPGYDLPKPRGKPQRRREVEKDEETHHNAGTSEVPHKR